MICTISKHKAERKGYADAMMLDWQGRVAECTGANIFFITDGKIHTPIADCFLDGITRRTVDRAGEEARHRGDRTPDHAGRARPVLGMLHHRQRSRGDGSVRDRPVAVHTWRHHAAADERLHGRSATEGQSSRSLTGVDVRSGLAHCAAAALPAGSDQRSAKASSACLASTQAFPPAYSTRFQNGACVLR